MVAPTADEQFRLVRDAFGESDAVLRIARRMLSKIWHNTEIKEIVVLFLGEDDSREEYDYTVQGIYGT